MEKPIYKYSCKYCINKKSTKDIEIIKRNFTINLLPCVTCKVKQMRMKRNIN